MGQERYSGSGLRISCPARDLPRPLNSGVSNSESKESVKVNADALSRTSLHPGTIQKSHNETNEATGTAKGIPLFEYMYPHIKPQVRGYRRNS